MSILVCTHAFDHTSATQDDRSTIYFYWQYKAERSTTKEGRVFAIGIAMLVNMLYPFHR